MYEMQGKKILPVLDCGYIFMFLCDAKLLSSILYFGCQGVTQRLVKGGIPKIFAFKYTKITRLVLYI